jgi:hypothetical protein
MKQYLIGPSWENGCFGPAGGVRKPSSDTGFGP